MKLTMHTGAHWQVELPADWILKNDNQGVLKFKSSDGNYGLDIAVWNIQTMERTEQDILRRGHRCRRRFRNREEVLHFPG